MKPRLMLLGVLACLWLHSEAQTTNEITVDANLQKTYSATTFKDNKLDLPKIPETLTIVFPDDFYNYQVTFTNSAAKKVVLAFVVDASDKTTTKIPTQNAKTELTFLNGKLWAIGSNKLGTAVDIPVDKNGHTTLSISKKTSPAATANTANTIKSETLCDKIDKDFKDKQKALTVAIDPLDLIFSKCIPGTTAADRKIPFKYNMQYLLDHDNPTNALSSKYVLVIDVRANPEFEPFTILKLKKKDAKGGKTPADGYEYYRVKKFLSPLSNSQMTLWVIGDKDKSYELQTDSLNAYLDDESKFVSAMTPAATATDKDKPVKKDSSGNEALEKKETETEFMQHIQLLEVGLNSFNAQFNSIDGKEQSYYTALACLKGGIIERLKVSPENATTLANGLMVRALSEIMISKEYYQDFCRHIESVKELYEVAINKKTSFIVYRSHLPVPDVDRFNVNIKLKDDKKNLFSQGFNVSGGLKLDFSTGIFITGLSAASFTTGSQTFRYKDGTDKVDPQTGNITTTYNGSLIEDTRKVVVKNKNYAIGSGVLAHAYWRSGTFANVGLTGGVFLNNSQIQALFGGSLMLGNLSRRFSLSGGIAMGNETVLSAENQKYFWNGKDKIYNSKYDLPSDYTETTSPATVNHFKWNSWFVALTYNFASTAKTAK